MLGAKIGSITMLIMIYLSERNLISIGTHVTVHEDARISSHTFHKGDLILGPVVIESHSYIGHRLVVMLHSIIRVDVTVAPQSLIASGVSCEEGLCWLGSPARQQSREVMPSIHPFIAGWKNAPMLLFLLQVLGVISLSAAVVIALAPVILLVEPLQQSLPVLLGWVVLLTIGPFVGVMIFSVIVILENGF